jgi:hypothetical protein
LQLKRVSTGRIEPRHFLFRFIECAASEDNAVSAMDLNVPKDPKYWQKRAEEAWSLAEQMTDAHTRAIMVGIAQGYENLFKRTEEQRTREPR